MRPEPRLPTPGEDQHPLRPRFFFQDLPWGIQQMIFEGLKFRLNTEYLEKEIERIGLETVKQEEVDDHINRNNYKQTISEWLRFADKCR
jgi:hypothetical protein